MCGIYGEFRLTGPASPLLALRAATIMRHRGPDDEGYLVASTRGGQAVLVSGSESVRPSQHRIEQLGDDAGRALAEADLILAFRRLAIVDLSPLGAQPMGTADGLTWVVFNGEIYNHVELRSELVGRGYSFVGGSDTEVLLAAYREWGTACVDHLNGMWAFCIVDLREPEMPLFLSRDRFGEKPLFLERSTHGIRFASEAKALVATSPPGFRPDRDAAIRYLALGEMPSATAGSTFFTGIDQLPPGSCMTIGRRGSNTWRYWQLPPPDDAAVPIDRAIAELRTLLDDSVRLRLRADVPVGTCLSGGLDSSAIAVTMARIGGAGFDKQHTFTAAYTTPGRHDEREHVAKVLEVLNAVPTFTFPSIDRLQTEIDAVTWHQDEPFGSTSIYAQWCVMRAASEQGVRVILDGQGADELFAGYRPFGYQIADRLRAGRPDRAIAEMLTLRRELGLSIAPLALQSLAMAAGPIRMRQLRERARRRKPPAVVARGVSVPADPSPWRDGPRSGTLDGYLRRVTLESSLPELLRYEDRNSMAHSVESRTPFLDVHLVESAFTTAAPFRIVPPWTKYVLRRAVDDRVPASIVWRKDKVGFETPEVSWRPVITQMLFDRLDGNPAADLIDAAACRSGAVDDRSLWRAVNLASWWQVFSEAPSR